MGGDKKFQAIDLRPGALTDQPAKGKVVLGKTTASPPGDVTREDVARVAVELLGREDTGREGGAWYDLLNPMEGEEGKSIQEAVEGVVKEGWTGLDGQDLERIWGRSTEF